MASLTLNKSALKTERDRLKTFERFLPSLDLKRQQLMVEFKRAQRVLKDTQREIEDFVASLQGMLELLGATAMELPNYVRVRSATIEEENVVGVRLPALRDMDPISFCCTIVQSAIRLMGISTSSRLKPRQNLLKSIPWGTQSEMPPGPARK